MTSTMSVHMLSLDIKRRRKKSVRIVHMCVCVCLHHFGRFQMKEEARRVNHTLEIVCARCDDDIIAPMQSHSML